MVVEVCPPEELPPGTMRLVPAGSITVGVYNCGGSLYAIEDRCSHDDGPLCEGDWEPEPCVVVCPRHGSRFDVRTAPLGEPADPAYHWRAELAPVLVPTGGFEAGTGACINPVAPEAAAELLRDTLALV